MVLQHVKAFICASACRLAWLVSTLPRQCDRHVRHCGFGYVALLPYICWYRCTLQDGQPLDPQPVPKKRGRPPNPDKPPRTSSGLNPDGTPKRRGRPPKHYTPGTEDDPHGMRRFKGITWQHDKKKWRSSLSMGAKKKLHLG